MKNADKSAFPHPDDTLSSKIGLTKREYFAAMAMQGLCNNLHPKNAADMPSLAVIIADALLKELDK